MTTETVLGQGTRDNAKLDQEHRKQDSWTDGPQNRLIFPKPLDDNKREREGYRIVRYAKAV